MISIPKFKIKKKKDNKDILILEPYLNFNRGDNYEWTLTIHIDDSNFLQLHSDLDKKQLTLNIISNNFTLNDFEIREEFKLEKANVVKYYHQYTGRLPSMLANVENFVQISHNHYLVTEIPILKYFGNLRSRRFKSGGRVYFNSYENSNVDFDISSYIIKNNALDYISSQDLKMSTIKTCNAEYYNTYSIDCPTCDAYQIQKFKDKFIKFLINKSFQLGKPKHIIMDQKVNGSFKTSNFFNDNLEKVSTSDKSEEIYKSSDNQYYAFFLNEYLLTSYLRQLDISELSKEDLNFIINDLILI